MAHSHRKLINKKCTGWLTSLLVLLLAAPCSGQVKNQEFTFKYDNKKHEGKLSFLVNLKLPEAAGTYPGGNSLDLDMKGEEKGMLVIQFFGTEETTNDPDCKKCSKLKNGWKVVFSNACNSGTGHLQMQSIPGGSFGIKKGGKTPGRIEFEITANGSGVLPLKFSVVKEDDKGTGDCEEAIEFPYTILNLKSEEETWQKTEATFVGNPENATPLKNFLTEFPNGKFAATANAHLKQYEQYEAAFIAFKANPASAKGLLEKYLGDFSNGFYTEKVNRMLAKLTPEKPPTPDPKPPKPPSGTPPPSKEQKAWEEVKDKTCPEDFRRFLDKFPDGEHAPEAKEKIAALSHGQFSLKSGRMKVEVAAEGGGKIRFKDLSLEKGLSVSFGTGQALLASFKGQGKYQLLVRDECGRDTNILLTNDFFAKLTTENKGKNFVVDIFGGDPPYRVTLVGTDGKRHPLISKFVKGNKAEWTKSDLGVMVKEGIYKIEVADSKLNILLLNETLESTKSFDLVLLIISLLLVIALALMCYLLFVFLRNRHRKKTIYDVEY